MNRLLLSSSRGFALLLCALAPLSGFAASDAPLFRSVLIDGQANLFSLSDSTGAARWVKLGESFEGWKLDAFDAATQRLTLTRDDKSLTLSLADASVASAAAGADRATVADADALLQKMRFEEMITKSIEAQQSAMAKNMGKMMGGASPEDQAKFAEFQGKIMKVMFDEMDLPGMRGDLAKLYADTFTATELKAQADFYSTPAGQAMVDKQPVLQERMTELMMPRMMKAMPKIQAMSMEFAKENAPKPATAKPTATATP
jgi:hypothetical protein